MQALTEKVLLLRPPGGLFDTVVVHNLFPTLSVGACRALVHRAVRSGEVERLKPGLFCLRSPLHDDVAHPFVLAAMLHYPSQISLESALQHHGLIPEAVREVASVTDRRSRSFTTSLGRFSFVRVPSDSLRAGVEVTQVVQGAWAFVSSPLRAIADLIYTRREVSWQRDGLRFLTDSMRIDIEDLQGLSFAAFDEVHHSIRSRRTRWYLECLREELAP